VKDSEPLTAEPLRSRSQAQRRSRISSRRQRLTALRGTVPSQASSQQVT